jgi:hypothetical protein
MEVNPGSSPSGPSVTRHPALTIGHAYPPGESIDEEAARPMPIITTPDNRNEDGAGEPAICHTSFTTNSLVSTINIPYYSSVFSTKQEDMA